MAIIGGFYVLTLFLGLGSAMKVGADQMRAVDAGNMAAPLLAQALGGGADSLLGNFMLAFVAAVAFATIVAVVAVSCSRRRPRWPVWVGVIRSEHVSPQEQVKAAHRDRDRRRDGHRHRHRRQGQSVTWSPWLSRSRPPPISLACC
jgi:cation/acetate symporter